jgi:hypothetical protein
MFLDSDDIYGTSASDGPAPVVVDNAAPFTWRCQAGSNELTTIDNLFATCRCAVYRETWPFPNNRERWSAHLTSYVDGETYVLRAPTFDALCGLAIESWKPGLV